jgi:hypothetical protein
MIGFNGVRREKASNRVENPLLQDVNIGWLEKIRQESPVHVIKGIPQDDGSLSSSVRVGKNGNFANLDALVMDAVNRKIGVQYHDDTDLVVVCGRGLLANKYFQLVNQQQPNTEALATDLIISQKRMGGLRLGDCYLCHVDFVGIPLRAERGDHRLHRRSEPADGASFILAWRQSAGRVAERQRARAAFHL